MLQMYELTEYIELLIDDPLIQSALMAAVTHTGTSVEDDRDVLSYRKDPRYPLVSRQG